MSETRIERRLLPRKEAAAAGIKTGTTFAYESVWVVLEQEGGAWAERAVLPTEAEARAWRPEPAAAAEAPQA
jgi:hypothetical protein